MRKFSLTSADPITTESRRRIVFNDGGEGWAEVVWNHGECRLVNPRRDTAESLADESDRLIELNETRP